MGGGKHPELLGRSVAPGPAAPASDADHELPERLLHHPNYESLAEAFLKAEGRGTIAAFSPSGLSLDGPAHLYHRAVMREITSGQHPRLGDALLAAQRDYAASGAMPELLSVYHLFGDPALRVR